MRNTIEIRDPSDQRSVVGEVPAMGAGEVAKTADFLDYYASFARQPWGEILADARPGTQTSVRVEPVGVVLAITPWNDPLLTPARKLGPALIAGNALLLKAASQTPLIANWLAGILTESGLPGGVLQVITGRDEVFGPVLAVTTATDFDEAVTLANDTTFGLSAAVFTTSLAKANQFIDRAETGQVSVNLPTAGWDVHHPFGGFRESGSAFKEQGAPGLRFYSRIKTAAVRFSWT